MNIIIQVGGKFHAFHLAKGLNNRGLLKMIFTSYPKFKIESKIPKELVYSIPIKEILKKIIDFFVPKKFFAKINYYNDDFFDLLVSRKINDYSCDIIVGWSGYSLRTFKNINNKKTLKVLERGSSHIKFQHEVLKKEYSRLGLAPLLPSKEILLKEINEYKLADYICVPSKFAKKTFLEKGFNKNKIKVIRLGVDLKTFYPKKIKKKEKKFRIISSGEISIRKGSHLLIEAFNNLKLPNTELLFVGKLEKGINSFLDGIKNPNIFFMGKKNELELNNIYNSSDLFILNSFEDGFGMVIPQAMACGLPVITTFNTGASEIIENNKNGFVIKAGDTNSLEKKIKKIYFDKKLRYKMSKYSIKKVKKFYSWETYNNNIFNFYKKIYNNSR